MTHWRFYFCTKFWYKTNSWALTSSMKIMMILLTDEKRLALFLAATIIWRPHHRDSSTRRERDLNLYRPWLQALLNEVLQYWEPLHHGGFKFKNFHFYTKLTNYTNLRALISNMHYYFEISAKNIQIRHFWSHIWAF